MTRGQQASIGLGTATYLTMASIGCALGGGQAFTGLVLGSSLALFTIGSLTAITRSMLRAQTEPRDAMRRTFLVAALKLPITVVVIFFGTRLSGAGVACFVASILLVYSSFIGFWSFSDA